MTTFNYYANLDREIDRVRFYIGDTTEGAGPLPGDRNFFDEEIEAVIALEGAWQRAVANCYEKLAAEWSLYPNVESDQFGLSRSHISRNYADRVREWRGTYGYPDVTIVVTAKHPGVRSIFPKRIDAYSQDKSVAGGDVL
jgi:hypothetical protein